MNNQRGATLIVALIMLVLMTLAAITSFNLGRSNTLIIGNQQHVEEAESAAKAALEEVLSRTDFSQTPSAPFGTGNTKSYDVNSDGSNDITVTVGSSANAANPRPCVKSYQILPADPSDTTALGCASNVQQNFGVAGAATWGAQCADIVWEVTAVAADETTQASVTAVQGIRVRQDANITTNSATYCQ